MKVEQTDGFNANSVTLFPALHQTNNKTIPFQRFIKLRGRLIKELTKGSILLSGYQESTIKLIHIVNLFLDNFNFEREIIWIS